MNAITTDELKRWMDDGHDFVLLDVLGEDAHEELRLPGSRRACVYEVTFLDQARETAPDHRAAVVVYCSGADCLASRDAAERLAAAGYTAVRRYAGGRAAWQAAGHPVEGTAAGRPWVPSPLPKLADGVHALDPETSVLRWVGRNVGGRHDGTMRFASGTLEIARGRPRGGTFTLDMASIAVGDLEGDMAKMLVAHLESTDFFDVETHPTATLVLSAIEPIDDAEPGEPNFDAEARLTMRGVARTIGLEATIARKDGALVAEAHFDLDRTLWGVPYGSGKLYHRLGMHLVDDNVSLEARLRFRA